MSRPAMSRPALFIDRDGTLIEDAHYLADARRVRLLPTAVEAVRAANAAQVPVVIVTNQSGIGRGLITKAQYEAVRDRTVALLAAEGAQVLATYHCPHAPDLTGACDCRKPAIGMYEAAARDHGFALANSGYIGDRWRDVQPALTTGGVGALVPGRETPAADQVAFRAAPSPRLFQATHAHDAVMWALRALGVTREGRSPLSA
jgi:D-glycero-D-manno-heptose 1,7-bisphosphate phosphatase